MTEQVIIEFIPDFSKLETGLDQVAKTGKVDVKSFKDIQAAIDTTATDTQGLIKTFKDVAGASVKMGKSIEDAFGAGVKDALDEAGVSVKQFEDALKKANAPSQSLKKELLQLKEAMARMKAEGKDTGKEFDSLRQRAGKLADAISDTNAEIKNAGSDTRGIDNVVGSISALAGGYAAVQGAAALFGEENEDVQKALLKVNGAMALAQGLQVVYNATLKEGALTKLADSVATGAQAAATTLLTFVMGGATVAARVYRTALLATGIGAIVILVLALVDALDSQAESMEDVNKTLETNNELLETSNKLIERNAKLNEERAKAAGAAESEILRIRARALVDQFNSITRINKALALQRDGLKATSEGFFALNKQIEENKQLQAELAHQIEIINIQGTAQVKKEYADRVKAQEDLAKKTEEAIKKATAAELAELDKRVKAQLAALDKQEDQLRVSFENQQDITEQARAEAEGINKKWDDLRLQQMDMLARSSENEANRRRQQRQDEQDEVIRNANNAIQIAERVASVFNTLAAAQSAKDNAMINSKRREVEEQLKAGAITAKAAEARQKQIDEFERRARQRAAEREKKIAVFQAVLAIPKAFLQGLTSAPPPYGAILGGIAAALAAVEAGIIASTPVPKFFKGKKDKYAGPGIVGDMGSEIVERGGRMFLYTKPTQTYLGEKDKVYTAAETRKMLHSTSINTTIAPAKQERFDYNKFAKAIPANAVNINIDKDFITESVAKGLTKNRYMDRRYSSK